MMAPHRGRLAMRSVMHRMSMVACVALAAAVALAQQPDFSKVEVKSEKVAEGVYMLQGAGGNIDMGETGSLIVAHENVRRRMSTEQFIAAFNMREPAAPPKALPVVTFTDAVTFHLNGDEIHAFHVPPAHTDSDSVVHFRKANVI